MWVFNQKPDSGNENGRGEKHTCILFSLCEKPLPDLTRLCPDDPLLLPSSAWVEKKRVARHLVWVSEGVSLATKHTQQRQRSCVFSSLLFHLSNCPYFTMGF